MQRHEPASGSDWRVHKNMWQHDWFATWATHITLVLELSSKKLFLNAIASRKGSEQKDFFLQFHMFYYSSIFLDDYMYARTTSNMRALWYLRCRDDT